MPHLVIERLRGIPEFMGGSCGGLGRGDKSHNRSAACSILVEIADLVGAVIFVLGSICFFPSFSADIDTLKLGCELFIVASVIYAAVSIYAFIEAVEEKGLFSLEPCENLLYVAGSVVFLVGTILFWPGDVDDDTMNMLMAESFQRGVHLSVALNSLTAEFEGSVLCIAGCLCFALAAFVNGLNIRSFNDSSSQMMSAVTSVYMCGALMFVMGSIAFLPDFGCSEAMVALGAWMYTLGSVFYVIGSSIGMTRTLQKINNPDWQPTEKKHLRAQMEHIYSTMG